MMMDNNYVCNVSFFVLFYCFTHFDFGIIEIFCLFFIINGDGVVI